jgi:hypothetical protein
MRNEFVGTILKVRAVEDTIRATGKYTKGAFKNPTQHPIQGEEFPSRVLTEYYEVYPDLDLDKRLPVWDAMLAFSDWIWGDTPHIDVLFKYNYQRDRAIVIIHGGNGVVKLLGEGIPGFEEALGKVVENGNH